MPHKNIKYLERNVYFFYADLKNVSSLYIIKKNLLTGARAYGF
ncbi:hypothetical protein L323_10925 [Ruminiclostridium papyrosolvens C7]|uniref:Uncharacterized protein n=1 Tax=Ruminiclostridium papyrosolvens C7 TaxID=1330534 RepID=U4R0V6_9FIRM|nr:hypothetical protein L323_10925 [Ruminiclostridium papyrosolvens C7]